MYEIIYQVYVVVISIRMTSFTQLLNLFVLGQALKEQFSRYLFLASTVHRPPLPPLLSLSIQGLARDTLAATTVKLST